MTRPFLSAKGVACETSDYAASCVVWWHLTVYHFGAKRIILHLVPRLFRHTIKGFFSCFWLHNTTMQSNTRDESGNEASCGVVYKWLIICFAYQAVQRHKLSKLWFTRLLDARVSPFNYILIIPSKVRVQSSSWYRNQT